jgi:sulfopyruvate decarboxylase subunit alpha
MKADEFCMLLKDYGFNFFAGVPCTILKDIIDNLLNDQDVIYITATREEEAIGIATGAYLGGKKSVVLMQNSGMGNSIGTLCSLPLLYKIPMLLLVSWRGYRGKDAPEHVKIGEATLKLLRSVGIPFQVLSREGVEEEFSAAIRDMEKQQILVALLLRRGVIE